MWTARIAGAESGQQRERRKISSISAILTSEADRNENFTLSGCGINPEGHALPSHNKKWLCCTLYTVWKQTNTHSWALFLICSMQKSKIILQAAHHVSSREILTHSQYIHPQSWCAGSPSQTKTHTQFANSLVKKLLISATTMTSKHNHTCNCKSTQWSTSVVLLLHKHFLHYHFVILFLSHTQPASCFKCPASVWQLRLHLFLLLSLQRFGLDVLVVPPPLNCLMSKDETSTVK